MVATGLLTPGVDLGGSSKVPHPNHQGAVEHTPLFEVGQECRDRGINLGGKSLHAGEIVLVGIPSSKIDLHKTDPRFHQPSGQKASLGKAARPVFCLGFARFFGKVKGLGLLGPDHLHRPLVGGKVVVPRSHLVVFEEGGFHLFKQTKAAVELASGYQRSKVFDPFGWVIDDKWGVPCSKKPGALTAAYRHEIGNREVGIADFGRSNGPHGRIGKAPYAFAIAGVHEVLGAGGPLRRCSCPLAE